MPDAYLALDLWSALGLDASDFDAYYERNGWAGTWANLLGEIRSRSLPACDRVEYGEQCELIGGHIGPHMGASDVGSSEPLPFPEPHVGGSDDE